MLDANETRHHLLFGEADWKRCQSAASLEAADSDCWIPLAANSGSAVEWYAEGQAVRLRALPFSFPKPALDDLPDMERQRRSAAADQFGNWYWIDSSSQRVRVWSSGTAATDFWPPATTEEGPAAGEFAPVGAVTSSQSLSLAGVAVSSEHFLLVGTLAPAGVLIFDLAAGGAPMHLLWPTGVPFKPFDIAAGPSGSAWILDRDNGLCWVLDRRFNIVSFANTGNGTTATSSPQGAFGPAGTGGSAPLPAPGILDTDSAIELGDETNPISIEVLSDGTLLVLDRGGVTEKLSRLLLYRDGKRIKPNTPAGKVEALNLRVAVAGDANDQSESMPLRAYDFAVVRKGESAFPVEIFVVQQEGNQAYVFKLDRDKDEKWIFNSLPGYRPMRRFGGRGLVTLKDLPYYDFAESWVPLIEEARPRYDMRGVLRTPVLDGKEPDCVWHRLMLDACVPSDTTLNVWTRWANEEELLEHAEWMEEPRPYLRRNGSEIPFLHLAKSGKPALGEGTWELLFQHARGRFLQIMIMFEGNQRATPSLRALRAYYPRFSYLTEYMPALYREDSQSAHFLEGLLANIEGFYTAIEDRIANVQALFDHRTAPADALEWLAGWFGAALDPSWDDYRRRMFIRHAMLLFSYRGTTHGLRLALSMALETTPEEPLFVAPGLVDERRFGVRIIERYLARRLPDVLLGDPSQLQADSILNPAKSWQRSEGRGALNLRYAQAVGLDEQAWYGVELPLVTPADDPDHPGLGEKWALFTEINLGFTPFAGELERRTWQAAVEAKYFTIDACNDAWLTNYAGFDDIPQPSDFPPPGEQRELWISHMREANPARTPLERLQWQSFLRSRYGAVSALKEAYNKNWPDYDLVPVPDRLPMDGVALQDWLQFEGGVLAIRRAAHRFSVLLPMPTGPDVDPEEPHRRLELARRIIALEKPAHTTFDVRFYWAMFRVGEARVGFDTCIEENMREQLIPPMVLGRGYLGAALVAPTALESRRDRTVLSRDQVIH
jgi:phage tail-like protein